MTSPSKKSLHAAEQEREDVRMARADWKQEQPRLDPSRFVFIDETGTSTNMTRLRGRCRRGKRLVAKVPHGAGLYPLIAGCRLLAAGAAQVLRPMGWPGATPRWLLRA